MVRWLLILFFFQAEDGIRDLVRSRGLGDVYKRQPKYSVLPVPHRLVTFAAVIRFEGWHITGCPVTGRLGMFTAVHVPGGGAPVQEVQVMLVVQHIDAVPQAALVL